MPATALSLFLLHRKVHGNARKKGLIGIPVKKKKKPSNIEKKNPTAQEDLVERETATVGLNSALWRVSVEEESF